MPAVASNSNVLLHFDGGFPATSTHDRDLFTDAGVPKFGIFTTGNIIAVSSVSVMPFQLCHLVGVDDGTNINIYVDGVLRGTAAGSATYTGHTHFIMGDGVRPTGGAASNGAVMFLGVYANVAWSAREVAARYRDPYSFVRFNHDWPSMLLKKPVAGLTADLQTAVSMMG